MPELLRALLLFAAAGLAEIGGGWLMWQWLREGRPWPWGLAGALVVVLYGVTLAIYCSAALSGTHLNPAVSLAFALLRPSSFPVDRLLPYWLAKDRPFLTRRLWQFGIVAEGEESEGGRHARP